VLLRQFLVVHVPIGFSFEPVADLLLQLHLLLSFIPEFRQRIILRDVARVIQCVRVRNQTEVFLAKLKLSLLISRSKHVSLVFFELVAHLCIFLLSQRILDLIVIGDSLGSNHATCLF